MPVERAAAMGDVLTLDAKAFLNDGENPSDFLLADQDVALVLEEKADWPMPGFAPQVVGMSAGCAQVHSPLTRLWLWEKPLESHAWK